MRNLNSQPDFSFNLTNVVINLQVFFITKFHFDRNFLIHQNVIFIFYFHFSFFGFRLKVSEPVKRAFHLRHIIK